MIDLETIQATFVLHRNGRFRIERMVGKGAMGTVFFATDTQFDLPCAIKIINPNYLDNTVILSRFRKEARILRKIDHPSVVKVYDLDEVDGLPYIVLEWVEGGNLWDFIGKSGPLGPDIAVSAMILVCAGIEEAHAKGVIHRDIKPENILLTKELFPKITDFGIARMDDARTRQTQDGIGMGSLGYMAPEQVDRVATVDERADVHALGVTLWTIMRGEGPLVGFFFAHVLEDKPGLLSGIPEPLQRIIKKATALLPEGRYSSVRELREELLVALADLPKSSQTLLFGGEGDPLRVLPAASARPIMPEVAFADTDGFDEAEHFKRVQKTRQGAIVRAAAIGIVLIAMVFGALFLILREPETKRESKTEVKIPVVPAPIQVVEVLSPKSDPRLIAEGEFGRPRAGVELGSTLAHRVELSKPKTKNPKPVTPAVIEPPAVIDQPVVETVRVGFSAPDGDTVKAWLVGSSGKHRLPCSVQPGTYKVVSRFANRDLEQVSIPSFAVRVGESPRVSCNSSFELCKAR